MKKFTIEDVLEVEKRVAIYCEHRMTFWDGAFHEGMNIAIAISIKDAINEILNGEDVSDHRHYEPTPERSN